MELDEADEAPEVPVTARAPPRDDAIASRSASKFDQSASKSRRGQSAGAERTGVDRTRLDRTRPDKTRPDRIGMEWATPNQPERTRLDQTKPDWLTT